MFFQNSRKEIYLRSFEQLLPQQWKSKETLNELKSKTRREVIHQFSEGTRTLQFKITFIRPCTEIQNDEIKELAYLQFHENTLKTSGEKNSGTN